MTGSRAAAIEGGVPHNAKIVLWTLVLVAAVANLNLSVANVALPSIGNPSTRRRRPSTSSRWPIPWAWQPRCSGSARWATGTAAR